VVRPGGEGVISVQEHNQLSPLIEVLKIGGFNLQQLPDITGLIWDKLVINVAINPLTGLLGVPNGALLKSRFSKDLMGMAAREAAEVARAQGVTLNFEDPAQAAEIVAEATGKNLSSMLQDIQRGAPTEIEVLCAEVVRVGQELGVTAPVNKLLTMLVRSKVEISRNES
jgi:2-dehydropantoate 2-reductase